MYLNKQCNKFPLYIDFDIDANMKGSEGYEEEQVNLINILAYTFGFQNPSEVLTHIHLFKKIQLVIILNMYNKDAYFMDEYLIGLITELQQYNLFNAKIII